MYIIDDQLVLWAEQQTCQSEIHGIAHWQSVHKHALDLWQMAKQTNRFLFWVKVPNLRVLTLFAYLHDCCRQNDGEDIEHGPRAAEAINNIRDTYLSFLTDEEFLLLQTAIRLHTSANSHPDITVATCFDADRLDLTRIGIRPDPQRMCTPWGKRLARNIVKSTKTPLLTRK